MKRTHHRTRRDFLLGVVGVAAAGATWVGREPLQQGLRWLTTRPSRHLVVYIDTTASGSQSLRGDRLRVAWEEAEEFLRSAPPGSTAEFFGTGAKPGEPEHLAPFSPLETTPGRLSQRKAAALKQSLTNSLEAHAPGKYSCIVEDCYKLMQRDYGKVPHDDKVPLELVVISDLRQFTYPWEKNDYRLKPDEYRLKPDDYLLLRDLLQRPEWVAARFPKPAVGPRLIRVHYMPPQVIDNQASEQIKAAWRQLLLTWVDNDPHRLQNLGPELK